MAAMVGPPWVGVFGTALTMHLQPTPPHQRNQSAALRTDRRGARLEGTHQHPPQLVRAGEVQAPDVFGACQHRLTFNLDTQRPRTN
jgi:hypothetical protein